MEGNSQLEKLSRIALGAMAVLFIGSIVFYKERILFADSAYKSFDMLNSGGFSVSEHRYGSYITQILPFLCMKLRLPVSVFLKAYAVSFNLFYLAAALILVYSYRQYRLAILMAFYFFLFVSVSYFWANDEVHQAVAWMFLLLGYTLRYGRKQGNSPLFWAVFSILAFVTVSTHFTVIIPLAFLWIYLWVENKQWPFSKAVSAILSGIIIALFIIKYVSTQSGSYDGQKLSHTAHLSLRMVLNGYATPWVKMFFYRCLTNYWIGSLVFFAGLVSLYFNKHWLLMAFTVLAAAGYTGLIGIFFSEFQDSADNIYLFHVETEWVCISIIAAAPFVFSLLPKLKVNMAMALLVSIFLVRAAYISTAIPTFTWRTLFKKQALAQMKKKGITKLAIVNSDVFRSNILLDWALGEESLLMSKKDGDIPVRTFFLVNTYDISNCAFADSRRNFYNCNKEELSPDNMNMKMFPVDTTCTYQVMTWEELFK